MSLTEVLMTLLILTIRCGDDLDFILIENVTLFSYDLNYDWISLIFENIPFFICDLGICCFSWSGGYIQYFMTGSLLFQLFGYRDRVIVRMISLMSMTTLYKFRVW